MIFADAHKKLLKRAHQDIGLVQLSVSPLNEEYEEFTRILAAIEELLGVI